MAIRTIKQIAAVALGSDGRCIKYALCHDNTIWVLGPNTFKWEQLPDLPESLDIPDDDLSF